MQRHFIKSGVGECHNKACKNLLPGKVKLIGPNYIRCLPVNPLVLSTVDCVKNKAFVFFQFPLLSRNALPAFSLALKMYFASSKVTTMVGWVSVERVVCTVADQVNILSSR